MVFDGRFGDQILPDKVHILNVAFLVPELRREFGGTAGNIAYNLHFLGGEGDAMGTVGADFKPYASQMDTLGISRRFVTEIASTYTAQAFITTDLDDNQITAFHPGAMNHAHVNQVPTDAGIDIGMVSPDGRDGMLQHAEQFANAGIPFIFDPGQGLPMFDGDDLKRFLDQAAYVAVNDYESHMLMERTGLSLKQMAERLRALIVTRGGQGSAIHAGGREIPIPAVAPAAVKDPTGCGDAYRAGLLYGLANELDWETTGRIASLMGAIKIASTGTQNHRFTQQEFRGQFKAAFGYDLD
ncbi:MAG: carbohydrate kinase family protein [Salinisphaera sp.]|nr:carbohydrate kinase family protein [Salinisphaera sp.]